LNVILEDDDDDVRPPIAKSFCEDKIRAMHGILVPRTSRDLLLICCDCMHLKGIKGSTVSFVLNKFIPRLYYEYVLD
jgi:hypothetical protein